jgi:hypothetical protein
MYFGTKSYLKSNRNHIAKQILVTTNVNPLSVTGTDHTDVVEVPSPHKQDRVRIIY